MLQEEYQLHLARLTPMSDHTDIPEPRTVKLIPKRRSFLLVLE